MRGRSIVAVFFTHRFRHEYEFASETSESDCYGPPVQTEIGALH
jgi:hypothetical protein